MGILRLFCRPHWRRIWTMHETAVAKNLQVLCGTKHIDWHMLERMRIINGVIEAAMDRFRRSLEAVHISIEMVMLSVRRR